MAATGIYGVTSIGRPLDRAYPTNRAVMLAMPGAALVYLVVTALGPGIDMGAVGGALSAALAALGGWALVRELAPDDERSAFVGLAGAVAAFSVVPAASVLFLFAVLILIRIVNRTVGLPARVTDSVAVVGLVFWTVYATGILAPGIAAILAFAFDAVLAPPLRRQWVFSALSAAGCAVAMIYVGMLPMDMPWVWGLRPWVLLAVLVVFAARIVRTRRVRSVGDATGNGLSPARVRAGMWLAALILVWTLFAGPFALAQSVLVWTSVGALTLGGIWRR